MRLVVSWLRDFVDVKASAEDIADTLAWILVQNGQNPRGLELLETAAAAPSAPLEVRYHLAVALKNAGRIQDARRTLEAAYDATSYDGWFSFARIRIVAQRDCSNRT